MSLQAGSLLMRASTAQQKQAVQQRLQRTLQLFQIQVLLKILQQAAL